MALKSTHLPITLPAKESSRDKPMDCAPCLPGALGANRRTGLSPGEPGRPLWAEAKRCRHVATAGRKASSVGAGCWYKLRIPYVTSRGRDAKDRRARKAMAAGSTPAGPGRYQRAQSRTGDHTLVHEITLEPEACIRILMLSRISSSRPQCPHL